VDDVACVDADPANVHVELRRPSRGVRGARRLVVHAAVAAGRPLRLRGPCRFTARLRLPPGPRRRPSHPAAGHPAAVSRLAAAATARPADRRHEAPGGRVFRGAALPPGRVGVVVARGGIGRIGSAVNERRRRLSIWRTLTSDAGGTNHYADH